ncbi:MAG TPA: hypothetical protein P5323_01360 [Candidatus Moranbacteria bacterium]|nr:hypothetical protein [Candidatus Moranbacteria bacterium]HSA08159.1 hypothetical protein [Candidatus Moranbacteria bacterium]
MINDNNLKKDEFIWKCISATLFLLLFLFTVAIIFYDLFFKKNNSPLSWFSLAMIAVELKIFYSIYIKEKKMLKIG